MSLFSRRVKATPVQLGDVFYGAACGEAKKLSDALADTSTGKEVLDRSSTLEYAIELIFFCMFPLDVVIRSQFDSSAAEIGGAFRNAAVRHFKEGGGTDIANFSEVMESRFSEYTTALNNPDGGTGIQRLGSLAIEHIFAIPETADLDALMRCSLQFAKTMKGFKDIRSQYRVT
jgi:hypothetical protein